MLGLVALLSIAPCTARAQLKLGDVFPPLATAGLAGGEMPATDGRVVIVDFWASWCAPCKASFPAFEKLQADYGPRGLVILAVSVDEKTTAYEGFVKKMKPGFPALHDRAQNLVRQVKVPTMPTSYLLDRHGRVRFIHEGFHGDTTVRELRQEIETLLAEPQK